MMRRTMSIALVVLAIAARAEAQEAVADPGPAPESTETAAPVPSVEAEPDVAPTPEAIAATPEAPTPDAIPPRPIARGRALTWGFAVIVPVWIGDVRETDGRALAYYNPGGGIEGRIGYELPGGIALGVTGGISAHASDNSRALTVYRGGAEARWTIDLGDVFAPSFGIAAGLMLAELDAGIQATAYARVLGGVQVLFEPWIAMELGLSVEGALGLDAFRDPVVWVSPQVGLSFYE